MDNFKILSRAGVGAHGLVFKALDLRDRQLVALKQIEVNINSGPLPQNTLREICVLRQLKSKHIVRLKEVLAVNSAVMLVMEYLPCSLADVVRYGIDLEVPLHLSQIKTYMRMILMGLKAMHDSSIMHRDVKPANLLISDKGVVKIADFGLSRIYNRTDRTQQYSHQVATRWYRAPELLYGSRLYSAAIDLWGVGCILAELLNNQPLFAGDSDIEQLAIVLAVLGTPTEETWPGLTSLPDYNKISFAESPAKRWTSIVPSADPLTLDLIGKLLQYDQNKRLTAGQALNHAFFFEKPLPCSRMSDMPKVDDIIASAASSSSSSGWHLKDFDDIIRV